MKYFLILTTFLIIHQKFIFGQEIYIKTSYNYNISTTVSQKVPKLLSYQEVNNFTLASGSNIFGSFGYSFNDFFSCELSISNYKNSTNLFETSTKIESFFYVTKSDWELNTYNITPILLFGQKFNNSKVNIFIFSGISNNKLDIKEYFMNKFYDYSFSWTHSFMWGYGLDYSYSINKKIDIYSVFGITNNYYIPQKAIRSFTSIPNEYLTKSFQEIQYVDKIENLQLHYDGTIDPNNPQLLLKEKITLNSIYFGIGIKYTL